MKRWVSRREKRRTARERLRLGITQWINGSNRLARKRVLRQPLTALDPLCRTKHRYAPWMMSYYDPDPIALEHPK